MIGPTLYCGDPHGQFDHIIRAAEEFNASAVVLLGDMTPAVPLHLVLAPLAGQAKIYFIHGNHDADSDEYWCRLWESDLADRNIGGRVVVLPDGTKLAGLGGVFRASVWYPEHATSPAPGYRNRKDHSKATPKQDRWRGSVHRKHWATIYPDELDKLANMRADVLVTHEAPGYHKIGFGILDDLARSLGVKASLHGHHHDNLDSSARWPAQGFKSYGVGLRGITAIDSGGNATVIVPGELDMTRSLREQYIDQDTGDHHGN